MIDTVKIRLRDFLMRTQKYTGTDNVYIARGSFWSGTNQGVGTLLSLLQVLAFAHFITPQDYGAYKYLMSIAGMLSFLTLTGMNTAVTQMTASGVEGALRASVQMQLKWNTLYLAGCLIVAGYYAAQGNLLLATGLLILGASFPLSTAFNTYGAYLGGKKDFRRASVYGTISAVIFSVLMIAAIVITRNVLVIVAAYAIGTVVPTIFFYRRSLMRTQHAELGTEDRRKLATYGGHLTLMNVLATIDQYIDKVFLFQTTGAVQLAVYSLALAVPERIKGYSKSFVSILLPKMSTREIRDIRPIFYTRLLQGAIIGLLVSAMYWIAAPYLFIYILPRYIDSIPYSRVLMLTAIFTIPGAYTSTIFRAKRMVRSLYISSTAGHALKISLYIVLGSFWGIWGLVSAAIATQLLGTVLNCVLWEWESRKRA